MCRIENLTSSQYSHLRESTLAVVDYTLSGFGALSYDWVDDCEKNDIVSDAVHKALTTYKSDGGRSFSSWLKMIAQQLTISRLNGHRNTCDIFYTTEDEDQIEIPELAVGYSPEDEVIGWEALDQVKKVLSGRSGIILNLYAKGYQPREIAGLLGTTPNAVSVRITKTRKAIEYAIAG